MHFLAYALSILNASKSKIPDDFAGERREGIMEEDYIIVLNHCAPAIDENGVCYRNDEYTQKLLSFHH